MPGNHGWKAAGVEWRVNWRFGVASFLGLGLSFGAYSTLFSLFVIPMQEEFGWSRTEIALAHNAGLITALAAPFLGRLIDRFGVREIMLGGMCLNSLLYLGLAAMNGSLPLYYGLYITASVVGLSASGLVFSRVISQHFIASRGLSLAIARSGFAVSNAVLPALVFAVISNFGWRMGYVSLAVFVMILAFPPAFFWVGHRKKADPSKADTVSEPLPTWRRLLTNRRVITLCIGAGLGYAPSTGMMSQLQPILIGKGIEAAPAAALIGVVGAASLFGAILTGALVDRFWAPAVAFVFACGSAAGALILALSDGLSTWTAASATLLIGLGLGAEIDVAAFIVARYFGVRIFASVYGFSVFAVASMSALIAMALGFTYDHVGDYNVALLVIAGFYFVAGLAYLTMGKYPNLEENGDRSTAP